MPPTLLNYTIQIGKLQHCTQTTSEIILEGFTSIAKSQYTAGEGQNISS